MQGSLKAEAGIYAPMLVPYTVTEPVRGQKGTALSGYAVGVFRDQFYTTGLRIEKLDSETHENLLHDDAIFLDLPWKTPGDSRWTGGGVVL